MIAFAALLHGTANANLTHAKAMNEADTEIHGGSREIKLTEKNLRNFWSKVDKNGPFPDQNNPHYKGLENCWDWTGAKSKLGYGNFGSVKKTHGAHRVSFFLAGGTLAKGQRQVNHKCDRRCCVNPAHLHAGTHNDNMREKSERGRSLPGDLNHSRLHPEKVKRGEAHWRAKLTEAQVIQIRTIYAVGETSQNALAERFGVNQTVIGDLVRRKQWAHVV